MSSYMRRRSFLKTCAGLAGASALTPFQALAAAERGRTKIRDIKVMMVQGGRTYTYIKIDTDAGVSGIGEGYGNPGVGVREGVLDMRPWFIGKDPLDVETLYYGPAYRTDGSAHMLLRAMSGIEAALWDLNGKILGLPVATLLGGRFRTRMRMYHDEGPRNMLDKASCRDWAAKMKADPAGWNAFKFGFRRSTPANDSARDPGNISLLTTKELRDIQQGFENCREAIGWMDDIIVHDGPVVKGGYIDLPDKPGLGIELNPDVVKAHLVKGETYWT